MSTTLDPDLVRAALVGRTVPQSIRAAVELRTVGGITGGTTLSSINSVDLLFFHAETVIGENVVIDTAVSVGMRSALLFPNATLTSGVTYYIVGKGVVISRTSWLPETALLWVSDFVAPATYTSQLLLFSYTNNVIGTI